MLQVLNKEYRTPSCYYYSEKEFKTDGKILTGLEAFTLAYDSLMRLIIGRV